MVLWYLDYLFMGSFTIIIWESIEFKYDTDFSFLNLALITQKSSIEGCFEQ